MAHCLCEGAILSLRETHCHSLASCFRYCYSSYSAVSPSSSFYWLWLVEPFSVIRPTQLDNESNASSLISPRFAAAVSHLTFLVLQRPRCFHQNSGLEARRRHDLVRTTAISRFPPYHMLNFFRRFNHCFCVPFCPMCNETLYLYLYEFG